jgi:hypothetical protein
MTWEARWVSEGKILRLGCQFFAVLMTASCFHCCGSADNLGDLSQPIQLQLSAAVVDAYGKATYPPLTDGQSVQLVRGGQGFHMIAMNVRATNLDACGCLITGQLYTSDGGADVSNQAHANLVDADSSGTVSLQGSLSSMVTLPPYEPGYGTWRLEGALTDGRGKTANASVSFVMTCSPSDPYCGCFELHPPVPGCDGG